ncbi:hypothetical protein SGPA1_10629 [Streptomyces misionensis JCM 4497]
MAGGAPFRIAESCAARLPPLVKGILHAPGKYNAEHTIRRLHGR